MKSNPLIARFLAMAGRIDATLDLIPDWLTRLWDKLNKFFMQLWERHLFPILVVLFYCRFSVVVVAIVAGLLWFSGQGKEIAIRVGDSLPQTLFAVVGAFFWAFHSWFDGRRVLEKRFGPDRGQAQFGDNFRRLVDLTPRLIGVTAYLIAASSAFIAWNKLNFQTNSWHWLLFVLNVALSLVFYSIVANRETLQQRFFSAAHQNQSLVFIHSWVMPFTWFYGTLLFLAATFIPVFFGFAFGSLGIVFFALSTIVSFGSWLILETTTVQRASTFPVMLALFA